jgi:putative protein-disulfide isomerase
MSEETNFFCDIETGTCSLPKQIQTPLADSIPIPSQKISILYFTDPICSSCWGIEPHLRKLKLEYGDFFNVEYKMGGLLESWTAYKGRDVKKPEDVAHHWDQASHYYEMPIDGDVWLDDPLHSSSPPSIAFKAAQMQDPKKALLFYRKIKEMVFLKKLNTTKTEHLQAAASQSGLDPQQLVKHMQGPAVAAFEEDVRLARSYSIKGFPSLLFSDSKQDQYLLYGFKPYEEFEQAILKWNPNAVKKHINTNYLNLFSHYPTLTTKEYAVLTHKNKAEAETFLNQLFELDRLDRYKSKNGYLWWLKSLPE